MQVHLMKRRVILCMVLFLGMFLALIVRMGYIGFVMIYDIEGLANELWSRDIPINSSRGVIYDCNGEVLVGNELALSVASINKQVSNKMETAKALAKVLEVETELIYNHLMKNNSIELIKPEGRKISYSKALEINSLKLDGIYVVSDSIRYYPNGTTLAQALGFCGIDGDGLAGIEYLYNDYLKSTSGDLKIYTDAKGHLMTDMTSLYNGATPGMDVYLSFDINIQLMMDNVINRAIEQYDPDQVMAIMVDVDTGGILGMTSYPYYDPSDYQNYDSEIYNRNLPIFYAYEPGSTFKIVTYAAGIEEGVISLDEGFYCSGHRVVADRNIRCWKSGGHGSETGLECIQNSCNPFFMMTGERLGVKTFYSYLDKFGFGQKTGVDLIGEAKGIILNQSYAGPVELACMSFGQTNSATELQLVMASIAALTGDLLSPYVLSRVNNQLDDVIYEAKKTVKRTVVSQKTADTMKYALESVVACGTGRNAYIEGLRLGGKTGTSQTVGDNGNYSNEYILSFLGLAPANDPKVAMILAIDNPKNTVQYGGVVAAPLVGDILEQVIPYLGIEKDYIKQLNKVNRWAIDTPTYVVPNVIGKTKKELTSTGQYKYAIYGEGDKVIYQSPQSGSRITEGDSIMVYLGVI